MSQSQGFNADQKAKQRREAPVTVGGLQFSQRRTTNKLQRELQALAREQRVINLRSELKAKEIGKLMDSEATSDADIDRLAQLDAAVEELDDQSRDINYKIAGAQLKVRPLAPRLITERTEERALEAARAEAGGNEEQAKMIAKEKASEIRTEVEAEVKALVDAATDPEDEHKTNPEFLREHLEVYELVPLVRYLNGGAEQEEAAEQAARDAEVDGAESEEGPTKAS